MTKAALEIVLIDDELSVRRGAELLLAEGGFRIAGVASELGVARGLLRRRRYDAALLPGRLGDESVSGIVREHLDGRPGAPLVVWAGRETSGHALTELLSAEPPGVVLRTSSPARLLEALRTVAAGGRFADPALAQLAETAAPAPSPPLRAGIELLSPREREVLRGLGDGESGAEIAARLFLSAETVRTHVRNAARKLEARTRTQAVALLVADEARSRAELPTP